MARSKADATTHIKTGVSLDAEKNAKAEMRDRTGLLWLRLRPAPGNSSPSKTGAALAGDHLDLRAPLQPKCMCGTPPQPRRWRRTAPNSALLPGENSTAKTGRPMLTCRMQLGLRCCDLCAGHGIQCNVFNACEQFAAFCNGEVNLRRTVGLFDP